MNNCTFTGYLTEDPYIEPEDIDHNTQLKVKGGPSHCIFKMVTYSYVRNKRGEKKRYPTTLTFEAWHTGAETIVKLAKKGTKMTVSASAKNGPFSTDSDDDVLFRVNEFDFGCLDKE